MRTYSAGLDRSALEACYEGNCTHKASSGLATVKVMALPTKTTVTASPAAVNTGQSVLLSAVVAPTTGDRHCHLLRGCAQLGTAEVSGGKASLKIPEPVAGIYTVTAAYSGNATHLPSFGTTKVTVTAVPGALATSTLIDINTLNTETAGPVTVPFTVTDNAGGGPAPTGTVTISDPADIPDQPGRPRLHRLHRDADSGRWDRLQHRELPSRHPD